MDDNTFNDIANALLRLREAFMRHGLNPPVSLELKTPKDGEHLLCRLPKDMIHAQPALGRRDDPDIVMNVVGVEIRFPAKFRAKERGGFDCK